MKPKSRIQKKISRQAGHPWDGMKRPNFDHLDFETDDEAACARFVEAAKQKFWAPWLVGKSEDGKMFGGLLYKPSGIEVPWQDSPENPHPGGHVEQGSRVRMRG